MSPQQKAQFAARLAKIAAEREPGRSLAYIVTPEVFRELKAEAEVEAQKALLVDTQKRVDTKPDVSTMAVKSNRHRPGYKTEYMRKWRERQREKSMTAGD